MALRSFSHICVNYDEAVQYVYELERAGIPPDALGIVGSDTDARMPDNALDSRGESPVGVGATIGTAVGGGVGLLAGLGAVTIPGVGPVVAAGWIVATAAGAGVGALVGALLGGVVQLALGRSEERRVAMALDSGRYVVLARVEEELAPTVQRVLAAPLPDAARALVRDPRLLEPEGPANAGASVTALRAERAGEV